MDKEKISSFLKSCSIVSLIFSSLHVGVGLTGLIPASYWAREFPVTEQGQIRLTFDLIGFVFYGFTISFLILFLLWAYVIPQYQNRKVRQPNWQIGQGMMSEESGVMLFNAQEEGVKVKRQEEKERIRRFEEEINAEYRRRQMEKGLIQFVDKDGKDRGWGTEEQVRDWVKIDSDISNNFRKFTPREFESFVKDLFVKMGYEAELTSFLGSDVIATKGNSTIIVEVKRYDSGNNISPEQVRQTLGSMWFHNANKAIFFDLNSDSNNIEKNNIESNSLFTLHFIQSNHNNIINNIIINNNNYNCLTFRLSSNNIIKENKNITFCH